MDESISHGPRHRESRGDINNPDSGGEALQDRNQGSPTPAPQVRGSTDPENLAIESPLHTSNFTLINASSLPSRPSFDGSSATQGERPASLILEQTGHLHTPSSTGDIPIKMEYHLNDDGIYGDTEEYLNQALREQIIASKDLEHVADFPKMCKLLRHIPAHNETNRPVKYTGWPGAKFPLLHQATGLVSITKKCLGPAHGCLLADQMGTGKTLSSLLLIYHWKNGIDKNEAVDEDQRLSQGTKRHLTEVIDLTGDPPSAEPQRCPSDGGDKGDPVCPCIPRSPMRKLKALAAYGYGVCVILVKPDLFQVWVREWESIWGGGPCPMTLVIAHESTAKNYPQYALTQPAMSAAMTREAMEFQANGTVNNTGCTGRSINNSVVVLSTAQSINSQFIDKMRFGQRKTPGARVSVFVIDEFHQFPKKTNKVWQVVRNSACLPGNPYVLALSAKPLEKGPEDLLALTDAMESRRPSDKTENLPAHLTSKAIEKTGKIWSREVRNNRRDTAEIREVIDETAKVAGDLFVLRTAKTNYGGGPCMRMPKCTVTMELIDHSERRQEILNQMADKDSRAIWRINENRKQKHLKSGKPEAEYVPLKYAGVLKRHQSRVCVNFPHLVTESKRRKPPLRFTIKEMKDSGWKRGDEPDCFLSSNIYEITKTSAKADLIRKLWMGVGNTPGIKDDRDCLKEKSRWILTSGLPYCVPILFNFCTTELNIRRCRISYIPPGSSKKLREAEILKFQTQPGDVGKAGWSKDGWTRILIAPTSVIAHGINLPLTKFITILEPDYLRRNQEELIGRAIRAQNSNDEVFARVISARNDNTERAIITRHEVRGQIDEAMESRSDRPLQGRKRGAENKIGKEPGFRPSKSQRAASRSSKTAVVDEDEAAADAYEPMDLDSEDERDLIDEYGYGKRAASDNGRAELEEKGDVKREASEESGLYDAESDGEIGSSTRRPSAAQRDERAREAPESGKNWRSENKVIVIDDN